MFGLISRIKGKLAYLNRKISLFKWHKQNSSDKLIGLPYKYLEFDDLSKINNFNFTFDTREYEERFSKGHIFCGLIDENQAVSAHGWVNDTNEHYLGELDLMMTLAKNTSMLYDFQTFEAYRGKGLYPYLLSSICVRDDKAKLIYAFPSNIQSCKGIVKADFKFLGTITGLTKNSYLNLING